MSSPMEDVQSTVTIETTSVISCGNEDEDAELTRGLDKFTSKPPEEQDPPTEITGQERPPQEQERPPQEQERPPQEQERPPQGQVCNEMIQVPQNIQQNQANQESHPDLTHEYLKTKAKDSEGEVQECKDTISATTKGDVRHSSEELQEYITKLEKEIRDYESIVNEITKARDNEITKTQDKSASKDELIKFVNSLKSKIQDYENIINGLTDANNEITKVMREREKQAGQYYNKCNSLQHENERLQNQNGQYRREYEHMSRELENIKKVNDALREEAAEYQSRLGDAKNYRLGDDDRNNSTRLTQDIEELQNKINTYARVKKGVELNIEMAKRSLLEFGYKMESATNSDEAEDNKMLIKALLQRVVLETIMEETSKYLQGQGQGQGINTDRDREYLRELQFVIKSKELINSARDFSVYRVGKDEVSHVAPTKIRQQIFALLGDRGFSDVHGKNGVLRHPFIEEVARILDQQINRYRTFKNEEKKKEYDELAPDIIREVIKILYFRCQVQEPVAEFKWIDNGDKIDSTIMQGFWDDQVDQWSVDICYFPLIGINLKSEKHRKVLYPAKVLATKEKAGVWMKTSTYVTNATNATKTLFTKVIQYNNNNKHVGTNDGGYTGESFRSDDMNAGANRNAVLNQQSHHAYTEENRQSENNRTVRTNSQSGSRLEKNQHYDGGRAGANYDSRNVGAKHNRNKLEKSHQHYNAYDQRGNNNIGQYDGGQAGANYDSRNVGAKHDRNKPEESHQYYNAYDQRGNDQHDGGQAGANYDSRNVGAKHDRNRPEESHQYYNAYDQRGNDQHDGGQAGTNYGSRNVGAKHDRNRPEESHQYYNQRDSGHTSASHDSRNVGETHVRKPDVSAHERVGNQYPPHTTNSEGPSNSTETNSQNNRKLIFDHVSQHPLSAAYPENPSNYTKGTRRSNSFPAPSSPGSGDPKRLSIDNIKSSTTGDQHEACGDGQSRRSSSNSGSFVDVENPND